MTLTTGQEARARREAGFDALDAFVRQHPDDALVWVLAPVLRAFYKDKHPVALPTAPRRNQIRAEQAASLAKAWLRPPRTEYAAAHETLFCMETSRHRWALEPVLRSATEGRPPQPHGAPRLPPLRVLGATRRGRELADEFVALLAGRGVDAPCSLPTLYQYFLGAARYLLHGEQLIVHTHPRAIVMATRHGVALRALLAPARTAGIASVYIPHAPLIADERFWDLPFDYAGLRGAAELEMYRGHGIETRHIRPVGDPGLPHLDPPPADAHMPLVFALPSVLTDAEVGAVVGWVHQAAGDDVVVSPHPAQGAPYARRFCPPSWAIWERRTLDLLRQGARAVLQQSSGVAVEAMVMGLPTFQVELPGYVPNYPALDPEHVPFVSNAGSLREALTRASRAVGSPERRQEIVDWGRSWSAYQGEEAAEQCWTLVEHARDHGPQPAPIHDAWREMVLSSAT